MEESDDALLTAWRGGDKAAGERLFDRYFKPISTFFHHKVEHGKDDLIQATFLSALESADRYRGEGTFRSFLFGIAFNVLRNHLRARRTDAERLDFAVSSLHDLAPRPSELLAKRAEQRLLLEGLRRIPLEHQVLLELYFWEPLSAPEIAEILGVAVGTIRTRIRRAKQLLEEALAQLSPAEQQLRSTLGDLEAWAKQVRADEPLPS